MANALTNWRGEPGQGPALDWAAFNAWRAANPGLSGWNAPGQGMYTSGTGDNMAVYNSAPLSETGGTYTFNGMHITPLADEPGSYVVYADDPSLNGKAHKRNGQIVAKLDSAGNYIGDYMLSGIPEASAEGQLLKSLLVAIGGPMAGAAMVGAAGGGFGAGLGLGGAGGTGVGGAGWMAGVEGAALAGPEIAGLTGAELAAAGGAAELAGPTLSKAALDGTLSFGANSIPGALDIAALQAAAPGVASAEALSQIAQSLGYTPPPLSPYADPSVSMDTFAPKGTPPPANPLHWQSYLNPENLLNLATSGGLTSWLGPAATLAGGLLGSQGQEKTQTETRNLPDFLLGPAKDLTNKAQGLLSLQLPGAVQAGSQMTQAGMGLLGTKPMGNGYGQVTMDAPIAPTSPYASGVLDDMQRRHQDLIGKSLLGIQGNAVASGGIGGSRHGVAQAQAISQGADNFAGQAAGFMNGLYNADMNRSLAKYQGDQSFWNAQRGQDLSQMELGAGLVGQGFKTPWTTLGLASDVYKPFTYNASSTQTQQQGGGASGAIGGLLGGAGFASRMGWWG